MLFTMRQLEYFVKTCETGSITDAALAIPVAQSSVSAAIAQLEKALGVQLLIRHHAQGVSPTPEGRRFAERARGLLQEAGDLERFAAELTDELTGVLDLGCLVTLASLITPRLARDFKEQNPGVHVRPSAWGQQEIFTRLREGGLNVAITYDLDLERDIAFEPLAALPPYAVFPADHPLAREESIELKELAGLPLVLLDLPHSRDYFYSLFQVAGLRPAIAQRSRSPEVIRTLVANGFGYTIVNARPVHEVALDGTALRSIPIAGEPRAMLLGLAVLTSSCSTRLVEAFAEHCRQAIGDGGFPGLPADAMRDIDFSVAMGR
ncbi:MAG: LysR family transcriptional regulator [Solirubrobacterales bacterium]